MGNRYSAPRARVAESLEEPRPGAVKLALVLIALFVLVACYQQIMDFSDVNNGEMSGLAWLVDWLWVVAIAVTGFLIAKSRRWARWVLLFFALRELYHLGDAMLFLSMFEDGDAREFFGTRSLVMLPLASLFSVGATILVFGPGRGWFEPRG